MKHVSVIVEAENYFIWGTTIYKETEGKNISLLMFYKLR